MLPAELEYPSGPVAIDTRPLNIQRLVGDTSVYAVARAFGPLAALAVVPVLASELGPEGFGTIELLVTVTAVAGMAAMVGLDSAAARSWFDPHTAVERRPAVIATAMRTVAVTSTTVAIGLVVFVLGLGAAGVGVGDRTAALVAFLTIPFVTTQAILREGFRFEGRRWWYAAVAGCAAFAGSGTAIVLVAVAEMGAAGYFVGLGGGALAGLGLGAAVGRRLVRAPTDRAELRVMLRFGVPLVPASLALWTLMLADRSVVAAFRGVDEVGLYGLGSRISTPLLLAVQAFQIAWIPFALQASRDVPEREPVIRGRVATLLLAATTSLGVVLVAFAAPLVDLLGDDRFERASSAVLPLSIAWIAYAASAVGFLPFSVARRSVDVAKVTGGCAAGGLVLTLVLVPPFGFVGAAWATAASYAVLGGVAFHMGQRISPAMFDVRRLALVAAVAATGLPLAALADSAGSGVARVAVGAAAAAALAFVAAGGRGLR